MVLEDGCLISSSTIVDIQRIFSVLILLDRLISSAWGFTTVIMVVLCMYKNGDR
jgi:hypothetical protein